MIRCLNCQAENADDAAYCANCGFTLAWEGPDKPAPPADDEPPPVETPDAADDATRELWRPPPPPPSRRPSPRTVAIALACVLAVSVGVLVALVAGRGGGPAESATSTPGSGAPSGSATATTTAASGVTATDRGAPFDPVRVHTDPSAGAPRAGSLHKGDTVTLVCTHAGFAKIGDHRWVFAQQFTETVRACDPSEVDTP